MNASLVNTVFSDLNSASETFAKDIAGEIVELRFLNVDEIKAIAKTRLWFAIKECLKIQISKEEQEHRKLVEQMKGARGWQYKQLSYTIAESNQRKKDANRILHCMIDYDEYEQLRHYVTDTFGKEHLENFYNNYINQDERKRRNYLDKIDETQASVLKRKQ